MQSNTKHGSCCNLSESCFGRVQLVTLCLLLIPDQKDLQISASTPVECRNLTCHSVIWRKLDRWQMGVPPSYEIWNGKRSLHNKERTLVDAVDHRPILHHKWYAMSSASWVSNNTCGPWTTPWQERTKWYYPTASLQVVSHQLQIAPWWSQQSYRFAERICIRSLQVVCWSRRA
jgi:hypothetical protein